MDFGLNSKQKHWLEFLGAMTEKELKARYKMAVLGFLWMFLNPVLQMVVMGFVFRFFIPVKVDNYFLFLFSGLLPWNFMSYTLLKNTPVYVYERSLIQKAKFPREAIVLSIVLSNLFHLLVSMGLFIMVMVIMGKINFAGWLVLPLPIFFLGGLTVGLSLLFSALNVRYRDISFLVQAIVPLWFYGTPVVYSLDLLPEFLRGYFYLNPMTSIMELFRFSFLGVPVGNWPMVIAGLAGCGMMFWIGVAVFNKESPNFDDWI